MIVRLPAPKRIASFIRLCALSLGFATLHFSQTVFAQAEPEILEVQADSATLDSLEKLRLLLVENEAEIARLRATAKSASTDEEQQEIEGQVTALREDSEKLEAQFDELATGVLREKLDAETPQLTLQEQIQKFLDPLFQAWDDATANPREIENLKAEIEDLRIDLGILRRAVVNLEAMSAQATGDLGDRLREKLISYQGLVARVSSELDAKTQQLKTRQANNRGFIDGASSAIKDFFRSRGFNILIAILVFAVVFFVLRKLYPAVRRISPMHRGERSFFTRLVDVLYTGFNVLIAFLAAMLTLFIAGDWLLLSLCIVVLLAAAWGARKSLPPFLEEIRLILNIGPVRENERIVYEGVPWKVSRLALYCRLTNPELAGGLIRLPAKILLGYVSRPWDKDEPWFPCSKGDWVTLSDNTFGRVILQTPENVQIIEQGGARKTFPTADFLGLAPRNLSHNFRIKSVFGIDYKHQDISTSKVPEIFEAALTKALRSNVAKENLISVSVPFASANASSLDYEVLADFKGEAAPQYQKLRRYLQELCVDVCNEHGWEIPFQQITIHQAEG